MSKIRLNFYKGVPFDENNENVLLGTTSGTGNSFENFLSQYEINTTPIEVEKFAIEGTDENSLVDVDLSLEPYNANYLKVIQFLDNGEQITKFYFIDSYLMLAPKTFRLYVKIDIWATYCRNSSTHIKNALLAQSTSFELPYGMTEKMTPTTSSTNYISKNIIINQLYRIVFHFSSSLYGELAVVSKETFVLGRAYSNAIILTRLSKMITSSGEYPYDSIDVFVVPEEFIGTMSYIELNKMIKFASENNIVTSPEFYIIDTSAGGTETIYTNEFQFSVKPEESKITWISTGNTSVNLPFNSKTYNGYVSVAIKNDFGIELYINGQFYNIIDDFKVNMAISEFAQWFSQNKNAESARKTNETLGVIGSGIGLIGSLASGNVLGSIGSGLNLLQTIQGIRTNDAIIQDRQNSPIKLSTDTNQILQIDKTYGLSMFSLSPDNYFEMLKYNQYYGYIGNQLQNEISYKIFDTDDRFRYFRCETMEIQGEFSMSIKNQIKELFSRGIRIWQYGKHFLDSFKNKLEQTEMDKIGE